ncbi:unnamed protein product [Brassica napus]|nr:unnamed protein product [Brassica napus]
MNPMNPNLRACDTRLPERLFATDRFPRNRLNIYSRSNILAFVRHVLRDSPAFAKIRKSSFGKLFDLHTRQCPVSYLADELEHDHQMDEWRRIRLALIIILDGVLIASQQIHRPTLRYVQMLDDVDAFLEFPWGRESFLHTIRCMKPPKVEKGKPVDSPVDMLVLKLKQETFRLTGFPLALQLLAFRAIPLLLSKISAPLNDQTIMDLTKPNLSNHPSIELDAVLQVEVNPSLLVTPLIPVIRGPHPG